MRTKAFLRVIPLQKPTGQINSNNGKFANQLLQKTRAFMIDISYMANAKQNHLHDVLPTDHRSVNELKLCLELISELPFA